jgi:hypothetical protein
MLSDFPEKQRASSTPTREGTAMDDPKASQVVRLTLTDTQKSTIRHATGRQDAEALELDVRELEERIVPRLASNHNEPLLTD